MIKPGTIWITGLSGSGKTSLGASLVHALELLGILNVELLDGDETRRRLPQTYGYSNEDRKTVGLLVGKLANECNRRGDVAIVCAISHVKQTRAQIREHLCPNFMEVYLDCSPKTCANRDQKGLYQRAHSGKYDLFPGITEPYEPSDAPHLTLNTEKTPFSECANILFRKVTLFLGMES